MRIYYYCKYCDSPVGQIEMSELDEGRLGFDALTESEKHDIIKQDQFGNIYVRTICDDCAAIEAATDGENELQQYFGLH